MLCLLLGVYTPAQAQLNDGDVRGELLYSTHCNACHTSKVHWRDKRLATDRRSLKAQVRRWQANADLGWSEEEITDVTRYLNTAYYHFSANGNRRSGK